MDPSFKGLESDCFIATLSNPIVALVSRVSSVSILDGLLETPEKVTVVSDTPLPYHIREQIICGHAMQLLSSLLKGSPSQRARRVTCDCQPVTRTWTL